jgi:5-hydroxyisourate hydrolase
MRIVAQALDGTYGKSAAGVRAHLAKASGGRWVTVAEAVTGSNGSIEDWDTWRLENGLYRILFDSDSYFAGLGTIAAYPEVAVMFRLRDSADSFHVQLTLCPYSYSTYFGSMDDQPGS